MSEVLTIERVGKYGPKALKEGDEESKWYGLDMKLKKSGFKFEEGQSYEAELQEWAPGRFNVVSAKPVNGVSKPSVKKKAEKNNKAVSKKDSDYAEGQREGNRRNVAAIITQGLTIAQSLDVDQAFSTYESLHTKLVDKDNVEK